MHALGFLQSIFTLGIVDVRIHTHWSRAIQSNHSRDVLELGWLQKPQQLTHGITIELENTQGVAAR